MSNNANVTKKDTDMTRQATALLPPVDVIEDASGITLFADLPGVSKDKLSLHVEADNLTIEGEVAFVTPTDMAAGGCLACPRNWTAKKSPPSLSMAFSNYRFRRPRMPSRARLISRWLEINRCAGFRNFAAANDGGAR